MQRVTGKRDRAIILTLLDTSLRASELCALKMGDLEQKTGRLQVKHGRAGGAKGGKGRTVFLGKTARRTLWLYLTTCEDADDPGAPLFIGRFNRPLNRDTLRQVIASSEDKAGVKDCHRHRFHHTMAITYLRSGGDVFTLQALLGHSTLDMVQHYARIAAHLAALQAKEDAIRAAQLETQRELEALMPAASLRSGVSRGVVRPHPHPLS
jgi:integrase/recombinase XerD